MPVGKRPAIKRKKKKVSPGGAKLSDRLGVLWDNWGDDLIERLVEDGINEADLLVLIGAKSSSINNSVKSVFGERFFAAMKPCSSSRREKNGGSG
jgi:hypothetical protein